MNDKNIIAQKLSSLVITFKTNVYSMYKMTTPFRGSAHPRPMTSYTPLFIKKVKYGNLFLVKNYGWFLLVSIAKWSLILWISPDRHKKAALKFQQPWNVSLIIFTLLYAPDIQFGVIAKRLKKSYDNSNLTQYTYLETRKNWRIIFITSYLLMLGVTKDGNVSATEKIDRSF